MKSNIEDKRIELLESMIESYENIIEHHKEIMKGNNNILNGIGISYSNLTQRFPKEFSKLLYDLKHKTDDVLYVKEVMETYSSIMEDVLELSQMMYSAIESSNQIQSELNE